MSVSLATRVRGVTMPYKSGAMAHRATKNWKRLHPHKAAEYQKAYRDRRRLPGGERRVTILGVAVRWRMYGHSIQV